MGLRKIAVSASKSNFISWLSIKIFGYNVFAPKFFIFTPFNNTEITNLWKWDYMSFLSGFIRYECSKFVLFLS